MSRSRSSLTGEQAHPLCPVLQVLGAWLCLSAAQTLPPPRRCPWTRQKQASTPFLCCARAGQPRSCSMRPGRCQATGTSVPGLSKPKALLAYAHGVHVCMQGARCLQMCVVHEAAEHCYDSASAACALLSSLWSV